MSTDTQQALAELAARIKIERRLWAEQKQRERIRAARQLDLCNGMANLTNRWRAEHPDADWADVTAAGSLFLTEAKSAARSGSTTLLLREAPAPVKPIPASPNVWRLEERTLAVLRNFAEINPSILIKPGSVLRSMNQGTAHVIAKAVVPQVFDRTFGIFHIRPFLETLKRFPDPVLVFDDANPDAVTIRDGSGGPGVLRLVLARPDTINAPSEKEPRFDPDTSFDLPRAALTDILKDAKLLNLPHIVVVGDGAMVTLSADDASDIHSHRSEMTIGETTAEFKIVLRAAYVEKLMRLDYHVEVGFRGRTPNTLEGIARFTAVDGQTTYWIATEVGCCEPSRPELRAALAEEQRKSAERYAAWQAEQEAADAAREAEQEAADAEAAAREEPAG